MSPSHLDKLGVRFSETEMDKFNKRSEDVFSALDKLKPPKSKGTDKSSSEGEFKRPRGIYTPPSKRSKASFSDQSSSHSCDSHRKEHASSHSDYHRHSSRQHHYHGKSHDSRRRGHTHPHRDPSKWTKYDLKDDGTRQLSGLSDEQINRQVAYQFLNQLGDDNQPKDEEPPDSDKKIVFKKPTRSRGESKEASGSKSVSVDSKIVSARSKLISKKADRSSEDPDSVFKNPVRSPDSTQRAESSNSIFKKPALQLTDSKSHRDRGGRGLGSVRVMPEYVVGVSSRERRKRSLKALLSEETESEDVSTRGESRVRTKQSSVVLSHLEDCED